MNVCTIITITVGTEGPKIICDVQSTRISGSVFMKAMAGVFVTFLKKTCKGWVVQVNEAADRIRTGGRT